MTGKKTLFPLFIILFFTSFNLYALDNKYENYFSFQIMPQFQIANGVIKEYVFEDACLNTDNKESQLAWNVKTIAIFNVQANFDILRYISVGLSASASVPQRSGFMQDYDWLNSIGDRYGFPQWLEDDPTELTNFSDSINRLNKSINFKVSLGGNIYLPFDFKITPLVSYYYEFIRFTASGGYTSYKWNDFEIGTLTGDVISYQQEINAFLLGLNVTADGIPRTSVKLNFEISPKTTFLNAVDFHYTNQGSYGTAFWDQFKNIVQIQSNLIAQYKFSKNHRAGISGNIQYIPLSKGNNYSREIDKKGNYTGSTWYAEAVNGGTQRFIWALGLNYTFSL